jgi:SAM-dependent methyltransferase
VSTPHPPEAGPAAQYDSFADIYGVWTETAPGAETNRRFYVEACLAAGGPVVELGVGDGRIAVEAAVRGCRMIGVDASPVMLRRCRERASEAGVGDRIELQEADFRTFRIDEPAALVTLPYHSIGHLTSMQAKRQAVRQVFSQLRPGGRFIFDDFLMTPDAAARMRQVQLRAAYQSAAGTDILLWVTSRVNEKARTISVVTWEDHFTADGRPEWRRYRRLELSWLEPDHARMLLVETGFTIDACLGSFDETPFSPDTAAEQIWIARKPGQESAA